MRCWGKSWVLPGKSAPATRALCTFWNRPLRDLVLRASQVPPRALGNVRMRVGEGFTGWVAQHQSLVTLDSRASADPRFKSVSGLVEDTYEAFLSVPIVAGGKVIGVINVHHRDPHEHTAEEIAAVTVIGEQTGS